MIDRCNGRCALCYDADHCSCKCHDGHRRATEREDLDWETILHRSEEIAARAWHEN